MMLLTIRTDNPEAEIGLFDDDHQLAYKKWQAHRTLAESLHTEIKQLLDSKAKDWQDLEGIVCYEGPGSFTGLRIGLSVANSLAYSLKLPIVSSTGDDWIDAGVKQIMNGQNQNSVLPKYGAEAHITTPKK